MTEFSEIEIIPPARTGPPKSLKNLTPIAVKCPHAPRAAVMIEGLQNTQQTVTIIDWVPWFMMSPGRWVYRTGPVLKFQGHFSEFRPGEMDEDGNPTMTLTITPTNVDGEE